MCSTGERKANVDNNVMDKKSEDYYSVSKDVVEETHFKVPLADSSSDVKTPVADAVSAVLPMKQSGRIAFVGDSAEDVGKDGVSSGEIKETNIDRVMNGKRLNCAIYK